MQIEATPGRVKAARMIAVAADLLQIGGFAVFMPGWASPADDVLDVVVGAVLTWLVGWHWSFLPSFLIELVPGMDLIPSWTAAVLLATRGQGKAGKADLEQEPVKVITPEKR
ncbi:MAG TPA: hypothetical protein VFC23_04510 [Thermoanaerobaculia bacterium]|nr:hypothetical protein [Thermoanaerobaculia bacterium]